MTPVHEELLGEFRNLTKRAATAAGVGKYLAKDSPAEMRTLQPFVQPALTKLRSDLG